MLAGRIPRQGSDRRRRPRRPRARPAVPSRRAADAPSPDVANSRQRARSKETGPGIGAAWKRGPMLRNVTNQHKTQLKPMYRQLATTETLITSKQSLQARGGRPTTIADERYRLPLCGRVRVKNVVRNDTGPRPQPPARMPAAGTKRAVSGRPARCCRAGTSSAARRRCRRWPHPIRARCGSPPACAPGIPAPATRPGPGPGRRR